jgi:tetratricopeptide (TPR) repeat protein
MLTRTPDLLLGKPYAARQEGLKRWGFTCTCALCSLPPAERSISDQRRERIEAAEPELLALWKEGKLQGAIRIGEEVLEIMKEEGVESNLTDQYVLLARLYLLRGDRETAEEYAEEAIEMLDDLGFLGAEGREEWDL